MTRPPVFISAPFAAATVRDVRKNIARAAALARLAVAEGYAPICPHLNFLHLDDETDRGAVLNACEVLIEAIKHTPGARLWTLLRDDGSLSSGCALEHDAWGQSSITGTWSAWRERFTVYGLREVYDDPGAFWMAPVVRGV